MSHSRLLILILTFLAAAAPLRSAEPPDYLFMNPTLRAKAVQTLPGTAFATGERVSYMAFNGKVWELTRFQGKYVAILLPDSWMGPEALSEEQIRSFVDRSDLVYRQLMDWEGAEPEGDGLLNIAIIPDACTSWGCGWGCGLVGAKGIEIVDVDWLRLSLWNEIKGDKAVGLLIHEMTHNFDVFWPYLAYLPDAPHAWTDFVNMYYSVYTQEGQLGSTPEEVAGDWLVTTASYFNDPTATWESCVRDDQCEARGISANHAWGGFGFRTALYYGPKSAKGFMTFLRNYRQTHEPPTTPEEKNDLYVEALSAGAGRNLTCAAQAWRWHISKDLHDSLKKLYGAANPDCADLDHDGFSKLTGDCDDQRASVHPGAVEIPANGLDDDCDGRVDESILVEPAGGDFPRPLTVSLPVEITARIADTSDDEIFLFSKPGSRVRFELCSHPDYQGFFFLYATPAAEQGYVGFVFVFERQCDRAAWNVGPGLWRFDVALNALSHPGGYTVEAHATPPWPAPPWATVAPAHAEGGQIILAASMASPGALPSQPTTVRFWVNGQGIVGSVPYAPSVSFAWTPPAGFDPITLSYRAQLLSQGVPMHDFTAPQTMANP
ncbi:MAG TPA: putative metal-binding motif-containing protein [Thermoanaerobaculia bacterium]